MYKTPFEVIICLFSDVNDNTPNFVGPFDITLSEAEGVGARVAQVEATDADSGDFGMKYIVCCVALVF